MPSATKNQAHRAGGGADLTKLMDKKLMIKLNGKREVVGRLRGYDPFMNIVLEQTVLTSNGEQAECQTVVIRGNSIQTIQSLEQI